MECSVDVVYPSVLCCSNLKLHQSLEVKNYFKQENMMPQSTFNPGLTLTGFRTTRPCSLNLLNLLNLLFGDVTVAVAVVVNESSLMAGQRRHEML